MLHHPPHIFLDDTWYQITASTYQKKPFLFEFAKKQLACDLLQSLAGEFGIQLKAWVVLINHYHLLLKTKDGIQVSNFIRRFHGRLAYEFNSMDGIHHRQVWHNYWDTCIRNEKGFWTRFIYIHHNPVKHGYVSKMEDWPYSSYRNYLKVEGAEWLADILQRFPIVDYTDYLDKYLMEESG